MALTILGIGNSSTDFFVDSQLAREGLESMAISGLVGGQMFNFLVGVGISMMYISFVNGFGSSFQLLSYDKVYNSSSSLSIFLILIFSQVLMLLLLGILYFDK